MADLTHEQISTLMDGESDPSNSDTNVDDLVRAIAESDEVGQKWSRYHLMRDVMQNEYTTVLDSDFASKVSSAIDAEPAIVAFPATARGTTEAGDSSGSTPVSINDARQTNGSAPASSWKRMASGFAIAASVAMVSIVGLNLMQGDEEQNTPIIAQTAVTPGITAGADQLELVANRGTYWVNKSQNSLSQKNQEKLNMFLSRHIENAPTVHSGMFPYSRLVGYDRLPVDSKPAQ